MDDEVMGRMMQFIKQKTAEYRADPSNLTREPEPVETIPEMYRELEECDSDFLLFMAEDSPTCRGILLRRILGLTPASAERRD